MRLTDLEPRFVKSNGNSFSMDAAMEEADGLWLLCPRCLVDKGTDVGVHGILCWRPSVPPDITPGPGRWEWRGTSLQDLTLFANPRSSVWLTGPGCGAHFFVTNGEIIFT